MGTRSIRPQLQDEQAGIVVAAMSPAPEGRLNNRTSATDLSIPRWLVAAFAIAIVAAYLCLLGTFGLADPDEPRYAEIAREMIELGDWVTPHLNYVKYFEKPPLMYWLTATNFRLFGMSEFVARLWPALFGLIGIAVAYRLGRAMYGEWVGAAAAALLAATPLYFGLSQILILDMPFSALLAVGLGAFWLAYQNPTRRRGMVLALYVSVALGVLTKGPVAMVLSGGIITGFVALRREWSVLRWAVSPVGIVVFFVITLPWFVVVSQRNPEFVHFFVINQHVARFMWQKEHQQPLWFFVPIVFAGMLPWSGMILLAPRMLARFGERLLRRRVSAPSLYCTVWAGLVFAFFSLSTSKLGTYILPMFCPLAILAARFFHDVIIRRRDILGRACIGLLVLAIAMAVAAVITGEVVDVPEVSLIVPRMYLGAAILGLTALAGTLLIRRQRFQASFAALVLGTLAVQVVAMSARAVAPEYRELGLAIRRQARPEDLVVSYHHYVQAITFYARRRIVSVGGHGELDFGSRQGDQRAFFWDNDQMLIDAWRAPRHIFLVIKRAELDPLLPQLHPPPRQIAAESEKVLVVNFPALPR